jgi:hypothetical protein
MQVRTRRLALRVLVAVGGVALLAGTASMALAAPAALTRVSVNAAGKAGNGTSGVSAVSTDGRFVAFESTAANLVPGDTNGVSDVFVKDRQTGTIERVSVSRTGKQATRASHLTNAAISYNGRYVVFESAAPNLVPGDTNQVSDIFIRDRVAKTTKRVSVDAAGKAANGRSFNATINSSGIYVIYASAATNLVTGDTNGVTDVFVTRVGSRTTWRLSVGPGGVQGNGDSTFGVTDWKGAYFYFESRASNLVSGDTNGKADAFMYNIISHTVDRISVDSAGHELADGTHGGLSVDISGDLATFLSGGTKPQVYLHHRFPSTSELVSVNSVRQPSNTGSAAPSIDPNRRYVTFSSMATNLDPRLSKGNQIYVRYLFEARTIRVSTDAGGVAANGQSTLPAASRVGLSFTSTATSLGAGNPLGRRQVYFRAL